MKSTIIFHAGMAKTGSTTIQRFLYANCRTLEARDSVVCVCVPQTALELGQLRLVRTQHAEEPRLNANLFRNLFSTTESGLFIEQFSQQLTQLESAGKTVVISGESISQLLLNERPRFMAFLEDLADSYTVRVVIYLRPQHSYMESAWREWGFREAHQYPSDYFRKLQRSLRYGEHWDYWTRQAPSVRFVVRPFVQPLLESGDVLADFCLHAIEKDLNDLVIPERENVGMSLSAINLLRALPGNRLWTNPNDNRIFRRIKSLEPIFSAGQDETEAHCRALLRELAGLWCSESNKKLAEVFPWAADHFICHRGNNPRDLACVMDEIDQAFTTKLSPRQGEFVLSLLMNALE